MKKTEQDTINFIVNINMETALQEYKEEKPKPARLRTCQASVYETSNYYLLKSYNTFIACMEKKTETVYDALRTVYGYTATSAKHISKFDALICYGGYKHKYGNLRYTAR